MLFLDVELYSNYPYWKIENSIKIYPHFGTGEDKEYRNLDEISKKYFLEYNINHMNIGIFITLEYEV